MITQAEKVYARGFPFERAGAEDFATYVKRVAEFIKKDIPELARHCEWYGEAVGLRHPHSRLELPAWWDCGQSVVFYTSGTESAILNLALLVRDGDYLKSFVIWNAKSFQNEFLQYACARLNAWANCNGFALPVWEGGGE